MSNLHFKINGLGITDKQYNKLILGRQMQYHKKIKDFVSSAKSLHIDVKRRSLSKAFAEFKQLYNVDQYYFLDNSRPSYRSDSVLIYYISKD